jgi:hypothetical protein
MERRPALMGPQMSRDHPATRAAGAAGAAAAAAPEVTPERLINCSGVLLLHATVLRYMLSKLYVVPFLLACPTSLPLPPPPSASLPSAPLPSSLPFPRNLGKQLLGCLSRLRGKCASLPSLARCASCTYTYHSSHTLD